MAAHKSGARAFAARLNALTGRVPDAAAKSLYKRGNGIMSVSKRDHVPVDLGPLRASGHVTEPERKGHKVSVTLAYGGPAAPYALAVHEHLSEHSPPSWRHTDVQFSPAGHGPKYLEKPMMAALPTLAHDVAEDVRLDKLAREAGGK